MALEAAGRAYVAKVLAQSITLAPGETLVTESFAARKEGGVGRDGVAAPTNVTGNRIVFSREMNGTAVIGNGSKVTITFLNDGSVESFRYDWPTYSVTGRQQATVSPSDILLRVQRVVGARSGTAAATGVYAAPAPSTSGKIDLGADAQLERLTCGYYDPGLNARDAVAPVQAACYYHAVHFAGSGSEALKAGFSGAVPAAAKAEPDSRWPEEMLLRGVVQSGGVAPGPAQPTGAGAPASQGPKK